MHDSAQDEFAAPVERKERKKDSRAKAATVIRTVRSGSS